MNDEIRQLEEEKINNFLQLYNSNFKRMYLYAKTFFPNEEQVEDVLQEVSLTLWDKLSEFDRTQDFASWAFGMIRIEVLRSRSRKKNERGIYDNEYLDAVADKLSQKTSTEMNERYDALLDCFERLPEKFRTFVYSRYFDKLGISEMASRYGMNIDAVYQRLCRARSMLKECVSKKMEVK